MTTYIVGCEYIEYDSDGIGTENDDPIAGQFSSLDEATAFAAQLKSDPNVFKTYIQTSDAPL
jgi:hypothetical protein